MEKKYRINVTEISKTDQDGYPSEERTIYEQEFDSLVNLRALTALLNSEPDGFK